MQIQKKGITFVYLRSSEIIFYFKNLVKALAKQKLIKVIV